MSPSLALLFALLAPAAGRTAAIPVLLCEPDAKVVFQWNWFRESSVQLSGDLNRSLPWTGKEPVVDAFRLKSEAPEELIGLDNAASFRVFRGGALETSLYIQRELLRGTEDDGIVIAELAERAPADSTLPPPPKLRIFHCRSR